MLNTSSPVLFYEKGVAYKNVMFFGALDNYKKMYPTSTYQDSDHAIVGVSMTIGSQSLKMIQHSAGQWSTVSAGQFGYTTLLAAELTTRIKSHCSSEFVNIIGKLWYFHCTLTSI